MAEFQEVMREWTRMCNAVPDKAEHRNLCSDNESGYVCPLRENGLCNLAIATQTNEDWAEGEHIIMSWAAEHPEPIYPTWGEWLDEMGVVGLEPSPRYEENYQMVYFCKLKIDSPIPADIATKLGIKPQENK